ncbi:MAG: 50S ribosomal protein L30 [Thermotoga sp.]|nr:MAG: 50S ribosomal protein L30 [Thermotoga sp.]
MAKIKITLTRSRYGFKKDQRDTVKALGLRKIGQSVVKDNTPVIRGMVDKIKHMVKYEILDEQKEDR